MPNTTALPPESVLFHDGKGQWIIIRNNTPVGDGALLFSSDGKTFFELKVTESHQKYISDGRGVIGDDLCGPEWRLCVYDPHHARSASIYWFWNDHKDQGKFTLDGHAFYKIQCPGAVEVVQLPDLERNQPQYNLGGPQLTLPEFLRLVEIWIRPLTATRQMVDVELVGRPHVFYELTPEVRFLVSRFADAEALGVLNTRAGNAYWFLYLLASSLVRSQQVPVTADDVQLAMLMARVKACAQGNVANLFHRLDAGKWAEFTDAEEAQAIEAGLLLVPVGAVTRGAAPSKNFAMF